MCPGQGTWRKPYHLVLVSYVLATLAQQGGIVGGVGQALAISAPLTEQGKSYNEALDNKVNLQVSKTYLPMKPKDLNLLPRRQQP